MSETKPTQWRTPDGVMRKIRMRRQLNQSRRSSLSNLKSDIKSIGESQDISSPVVRRPNPFAQKRPLSEVVQPEKKRILSCSDYERKVVNVSQEISETKNQNLKETQAKSYTTPFVYLEEDSIQSIFTEEKVEESSELGVESLPVDWTIKRKVRFLSKSSFSWCNRIKGAEEAAAITRAVRCEENDIGISSTPEMLQKKWRIELVRFTTHWQHPNVPWLTLYPRFGPQQKLHQGGAPGIPQNDEVTKSFYDSWVIAFRSAYQLVKEGLCPFFYVCAQQYTAIFKAAKFSQKNEITCVLTPTTTGVRHSLTKEGIKFTQPLLKVDQKKEKENKENEITLNRENVTESKDLTGKKEEQCEIDQEDDAKWEMISEGIQFSGAKELRHNVVGDTSSRSAVLVSGNSNTQLLFNYLLNSRSSIATSGVQAHLPPTILAPVAFQGASLQKLNVRAGIAKTFTESSLNRGLPSDARHKFSLDISGPLLPHAINGLTELLKRTQSPCGYQAALSSSIYTAPFNIVPLNIVNEPTLTPSNDNENNVVSKTEETKNNFGLTAGCLSQLLSTTEPSCICQVTLNNGLYSWKV